MSKQSSEEIVLFEFIAVVDMLNDRKISAFHSLFDYSSSKLLLKHLCESVFFAALKEVFVIPEGSEKIQITTKRHRSLFTGTL